MKPEIKKLLILNAPYLLFVYLFDKVGQAARLAPGADMSAKLLSIGDGFAAAFSNALPSLHPIDLLIGIAGAAIIRLGSQSKIFNASSGSISANARVTNVELNVTVSRGSIPFYIVVESPNGYQAERYISTSGKVEFDEFNDFYPKGTWKIYIYNRGSAFTDVSTATARITVNYGYDSYS